MIWQDIVLSFCGLGYALAMIPTIKCKETPPVSTSVLTSLLLFTTVCVYITLGLVVSSVVTSFTLIAWAVIAIQGVKKYGFLKFTKKV